MATYLQSSFEISSLWVMTCILSDKHLVGCYAVFLQDTRIVVHHNSCTASATCIYAEECNKVTSPLSDRKIHFAY